MRCAIVVATLAGLVSAGPVGAQGTAPQERINTALTRAKQVGLPIALLESKIAEGRAKGKSQEVIAAAIERRLTALERASQALRGDAAVASLAVGADAIEAGVSEAVLRALAENAPRDRRDVAIAALTELVNQGQAPERALNRVQDALKRGPDALSNLPGESSGRGSGQPVGQQRGNSGSSGGNSGSSGKGASSGKSGGAGFGADSGPPAAAVPGPGQPSQAARPDNSGRGSGGSGNSGGGNSGGGNSRGGGGGGNPGRGGQ